MEENAAASDEAPVTFRVYTPEDICAGRAPVRSVTAPSFEPKRVSLRARIGMVAIGVVTVLFTVAAVIAVSMDEPKPSRSATSPPPPAVLSEPASASAAFSEPASASAVGAAIDVDDEGQTYAPAPSAHEESVPMAPSASPLKPKSKPATTFRRSTPPAVLEGVAPPPNPYAR